jgi:D-lactate dehydrogenase (cytochrome)
MKEWVASLTVVLADGTIIKTRQRPRKSSAGYDLTRMFIGSEGTLGLVTEATLQLTSKPRNVRVAAATFPSMKDAADCVYKIVDSGVPIGAVELLDDVQMRCINESGTTSRPWKEEQTLLFKFDGTQSGVKEQIGIVQKLANASKSRSFEFARNDAEADELWSARKDALWSVMAKRREGDHVWVTDVAVPISKLPEIVDRTKADIGKSGLMGTIVGHVGDGNFHGESNPMGARPRLTKRSYSVVQRPRARCCRGRHSPDGQASGGAGGHGHRRAWRGRYEARLSGSRA